MSSSSRDGTLPFLPSFLPSSPVHGTICLTNPRGFIVRAEIRQLRLRSPSMRSVTDLEP